jgi:hypothetical protein
MHERLNECPVSDRVEELTFDEADLRIDAYFYRRRAEIASAIRPFMQIEEKDIILFEAKRKAVK